MSVQVRERLLLALTNEAARSSTAPLWNAR